MALLERVASWQWPLRGTTVQLLIYTYLVGSHASSGETNWPKLNMLKGLTSLEAWNKNLHDFKMFSKQYYNQNATKVSPLLSCQPCYPMVKLNIIDHAWSKHVRQCLVVSGHVWQWNIATGQEHFLRTMFWICFMVKFPDNQTLPKKDLEKEAIVRLL